VLDVGGGEGYLARILCERGYRVTCLAAPNTVAPGLRQQVEVIEADLDFEFPSLPDRFFAVICGDVLEHLRAPEELLSRLTEVLEPGGVLIASLPNSGHWYFRWTILRGKFPADDRGLFDRTHLHFYTWDGWQDLFRRSGFRVEEFAPTAIPFGLAWGRSPDDIAVRIMEQLSYQLGRLRKTLFAYQFVVKCHLERG
jgi:SAM-dependent methyltransferase